MNVLKVFMGLMLVFIGITMLSISTLQNVQVGGVVMIGPIPIVFGSNSRMATIAIVLTLLLMILGFLMIFMSYRGI
jgi:uncharacterized protein (TIGR00304 family)